MMSSPIEDYALLSNCRTAALVARDGSIDWLCLPRFDAASVFGALLGDDDHGSWRLRPSDPAAVAERRYEGDTFTLVTRWTTASGVAEVRDILPVDTRRLDTVHRMDLVRRVVGVEGSVEFAQQLRLRLDYARALPWVRRVGAGDEIRAIAGPDALRFTGAPVTATDHAHTGEFTVDAGDRRDLLLTWHPSHHEPPAVLDVDEAISHTEDWWQRWSDRIEADGVHRDAVVRSLLLLRALTHRDTGGIVAAATTSLPEDFGGERNWDYRYVWLRDAALTLEALIAHGFLGVVEHWRAWLLRAIAGDPEQMQIMYGIAGERDLAERTLTSLPGYADSRPVRIGNEAAGQYQADVIGEVMVALHAGREAGIEESAFSWSLERALLRNVEAHLPEPDHGIWEIRGEPRMFTHSRVMIWAAFDRGVRAVRSFGLDGPVEHWERLRDRMREEIESQGIGAHGGFTQSYGTDDVDAALLQLPMVGFCAADDPRMLATVAVIEKTLVHEGLVHRYRTATGVDGLSGDEHPFLACSFWLAEQYAASGRLADAERLLDRLCALRNDVGMLSEEYDPVGDRHVGNTPQALSHLALVRTVDAITRAREEASIRPSADE